MELANYKACICEGSAENAIIDILLDYDLMIFKSRRDELKKKYFVVARARSLNKNI